MADLENNINSEINTSENIDPMVGIDNPTPQIPNQEDGVNFEPSNSVEENQGNSDFTQIFAENLAENSEVPAQSDATESVEPQQPEIPEVQPEISNESDLPASTDTAPELSQEGLQNDLVQTEMPSISEETIQGSGDNTGVILGKFENDMINTVEDNPLQGAEIGVVESQNVLESSQTIGESSILTANAQNAEHDKSAQKEKLLHIIKSHESKAKKSGFLKGIFSGALLTLGILAIAFVFAKDQIIGLITDSSSNNSGLSANVVDMNNNIVDDEDDLLDDEDKLLDDEDKLLDDEDKLLDDEDKLLDDEDKLLDDEDEEIDDEDEEFEDEDDKIDDEDKLLDNEHALLGDKDDKIDDEDKLLDDEVTNHLINDYNKFYDEEDDEDYLLDDEDEEIDDEEDDSPYSIVHVTSEDKANRVLPAHCSDLTCYGEDKEFTPCSSFRMISTLDENANRIGNSGTCRYKDISELVYVQFK